MVSFSRCSSCENVLNGIGKQITKANSIKEKKQKQSTQLEQEVRVSAGFLILRQPQSLEIPMKHRVPLW